MAGPPLCFFSSAAGLYLPQYPLFGLGALVICLVAVQVRSSRPTRTQFLRPLKALNHDPVLVNVPVPLEPHLIRETWDPRVDPVAFGHVVQFR
jgi:hypothetical protein